MQRTSEACRTAHRGLTRRHSGLLGSVTKMVPIALLALLCTRLHAPAPGFVLQPAAPPAAEGAPEEMSIEEVGALFERGQDLFETSDFAAAIELWTRAYAGLPDDPRYAATRALLMANIAQAHVEAHAMDGEIDHLRHADRLFEQYLATIDPDDEETRASVEAERRQIAEALARHDAELEAARANEDARDDAQPMPQPTAPPPTVITRPAVRRDGPRYDKWERAMVIGGGVTLAFGVGTIGALGTFLWLREEARRDGERAARDPATTSGELRDQRRVAMRFDSLAISTGAAAGVLTVIGIGVIAAAEAHRVRRGRNVEVGLQAGGGTIGLRVGGAF